MSLILRNHPLEVKDIMPLPVIPQLERSRQNAAQANNSSSSASSAAQERTTKYIPPAKRCPMTLVSRCDQTSTPLRTNHRESPGVQRVQSTDLRSTMRPRSRSWESSRSSKSESSSGGISCVVQPSSLKLTARCDQISSPSSRKHREFQGVLSLKKDEQRSAPIRSPPFGSSVPESSVSDSFSTRLPVTHKSHTEVRDGAEIWEGRRKGGNRAPKIEPEGTKTWRKLSASNDRIERESQESIASRDSEEQNESTYKNADLFILEPRFQALCRAKNSDTCSSSVSLEHWFGMSDETPSEGSESVIRCLWTKTIPILLRGRSRFFPNTLSDEENLLRNYKDLCKRWNIDPAIHLEEVLSG